MKTVGIFNPYLSTRGGGEKVCLALASVLSNNNFQVTLITYGKIDLKELGLYFGINLSKIDILIVKPNIFSKLINRLPVPGGVKNYFSDLSVYNKLKKSNFDLFINNCISSNLPNPSKFGIYMCMFPQQIKSSEKASIVKGIYLYLLNQIYRASLHVKFKHSVYSYSLVTANSKYTQNYILKYWATDSTVLYPICDDMSNGAKTGKENIILNVGRFFEKNNNNHHKKQDVLLDVFKAMDDIHKKGWQLHFAGSVAEDVGALKYILQLLKDSRGYPVFFHFNSPLSELKQLYNSSKIYWHATGFGMDQKSKPETQEHFGITTVEAMSAGCIPIVINSAGQKEIVTHGQNGYLWSNKNELTDLTNFLINSEKINIENLKKAARITASNYFIKEFEKSSLEILSKK